jgi:hypothetical protein
LRSAVALELAAGKVWALPKTVQIQLVGSSGATARATLNGLGATARAPVAASHHACGREELLRCWADSETRLQGAGVPSIPSLLKTERRGRGLDSVARDNLADSLMAQGQRCLPYPNPIRPSHTVMGGRPLHGAGRQPVIAESTPSPGGMLNHPRDTALERLSVWIRNTGGSPECRGPRQPLLLLRAGREATRMGATRTRTSWHGNSWAYKRIQWTSRRAGLRQPRARLGPLEFGTSDHPAGPRHHTCGPAGWQVLQVFQPVTIHGTDHPLTQSESTRQTKRFPVRRFNFTPNLS